MPRTVAPYPDIEMTAIDRLALAAGGRTSCLELFEETFGAGSVIGHGMLQDSFAGVEA